MYYHVNSRAVPFVSLSLRFNRSIFYGQHCSVLMDVLSTKEFSGVKGYSAQFSVRDALKAAIGEHIERTSLYINAGNFKSEKCVAFNLVTGETLEIPASRILHNFDSKIFRKMETCEDLYNDSSGVASFLNSATAIEKGFLEFFERQSLVYNWLTQSEGYKIDASRIDNPELHTMIRKTFHFIDELHVIDISIHPSIVVALALGIGEHHMGMGVSANWDLEKAVAGSIGEMFQFFNMSKNKHYVQQDDLRRNQELEPVDEDDPHWYSNFFFSYFDPLKLRQAYSYLIDSPKMKTLTDKRPVPENLAERILQVSRDLDINIYACFIPTVRKGLKTKIVKVFSPEGYPHINTKKINPMDYPITHSLGNAKFPNLRKPIPFP